MNDYQQHPTAAEAHLTAEQEAESDAKKITVFRSDGAVCENKINLM